MLIETGNCQADITECRFSYRLANSVALHREFRDTPRPLCSTRASPDGSLEFTTVSDLLGASARRMLKALAEGEADPAALATLGDRRLRATPAELRDALGSCTELNPVYR